MQKVTACLSLGIVGLLHFLQPGPATFVCAEGAEKSSSETGELNRNQLQFYAQGYNSGTLAGSKYMISLHGHDSDLRASELIAKSTKQAFVDLNESVKEVGPVGFHSLTSPKTVSLYKSAFTKGFEEAWPMAATVFGESFDVQVLANLTAAEKAKGPQALAARHQERLTNELKNAVVKEATRLNIPASVAVSIYEPMTPEGIEKYLHEK